MSEMSNSEEQGEIQFNVRWSEDMTLQRTIEASIRLVEQK